MTKKLKFGAAQVVKAKLWAQKHYADPSNDDIEILQEYPVTRSADDGCWVAARVYVRLENIQ